MNTAIVFRSVLIALFLFTYQTTTIHTKHHHIEEVSECHICEASKVLGRAHHETPFLELVESVAVEVAEIETKQLTETLFETTQKPDSLAVDLEGMHLYVLGDIPPAYYATAPPSIFL